MTAPSRASSPTNARRTDAFEPFPRAALHDSLVARFACQVARHSDRLAVKMGEHALTYADLDRAANRIAHAMLDRLGPGNEPVAILLPQSLRQVAAVLGALKAGKIYVPLDVAHGARRLGDVIADAVVRLHYYRGRLAAHGGLGPAARLAASRAAQALAALLGRARPGVGPEAAPGPTRPRREAGSLAARYERLVRRYIPARYGGRVIVLRSEDKADPRPDLGWRSVCRHVESHAVPGDHLGAITRHIVATGARLRACLERGGDPA
jgi:hypothetical protein